MSKEAREWYAKERGISVEELDDYDLHVTRVAQAYADEQNKELHDAYFRLSERVIELEEQLKQLEK